jgi:hypothetical protein
MAILSSPHGRGVVIGDGRDRYPSNFTRRRRMQTCFISASVFPLSIKVFRTVNVVHQNGMMVATLVNWVNQIWVVLLISWRTRRDDRPKNYSQLDHPRTITFVDHKYTIQRLDDRFCGHSRTISSRIRQLVSSAMSLAFWILRRRRRNFQNLMLATPFIFTFLIIHGMHRGASTSQPGSCSSTQGCVESVVGREWVLVHRGSSAGIMPFRPPAEIS